MFFFMVRAVFRIRNRISITALERDRDPHQDLLGKVFGGKDKGMYIYFGQAAFSL